MEDKELIISVIQQYEKAQQISADIPGQPRHNLRRGNKHTISSYLEDITGAFITDLLDQRFEVWIDQTFYFGTSKNQFRPDITIVKSDGDSNLIVGFIEVKDSPNPFRWKSTGNQNRSIEYVTQRVDKLNSYRGQSLKYKAAGIKKRVEITVSTLAKFDLVLFSDRLFKKEKLEALRAACNDENICLHILLQGYHPNVKHHKLTAPQLITKLRNNNLAPGVYDESSLRQRIRTISEI